MKGLIIAMLFLFSFAVFSQREKDKDEKTKKVKTTSERIDSLLTFVADRYLISIRGNRVVVANSCDTIRINVNQFTAEELRIVNEIAKAQREIERLLRQRLKDVIEEAGIRFKPKPDSTKFTTYFIINKNRALSGAAAGILGLDSTRIETITRHRLDSSQICYKTPEIDKADTTLLKNQAAAGNLFFPTYFVGEDTLRNFLDDFINGWTFEELP